MIKVFLKNGVSILHADSTNYSFNLSGNLVYINDDCGNPNGFYILDNIAGVCKMPKEFDEYRDQWVKEALEKYTDEESRDD